MHSPSAVGRLPLFSSFRVGAGRSSQNQTPRNRLDLITHRPHNSDAMWLIDTRTLRLKFFMSIEGVRYAILSHTWGDEEVDFQEMGARGPNGLRKAGWRKIVETCRVAREAFALGYAWVDTCCIDKSSSAELSEAINSMFSWYKAAAVCLVYLEDMAFAAGEVPQLGSAALRESLRACRWFTRGWTLQELIAPSEMAFYDGNWLQVATKAGLVGDLSKITGIEEHFLQNVDLLPAAPVGKRMSWASSRQTTRLEDEVWMVVVVVTAETAGAPEACRTLPGPSLVPATFLLFDLGSGTSSSCSSVEDLRLLLRLVLDQGFTERVVCNTTKLTLAEYLASPYISLTPTPFFPPCPRRLRHPHPHPHPHPQQSGTHSGTPVWARVRAT